MSSDRRVSRAAVTAADNAKDRVFPSVAQASEACEPSTIAYTLAPAETAAEHVRNAMQLLVSCPTTPAPFFRLYSQADVNAIRDRLVKALETLEAPPLHAAGFMAGFKLGDDGLEPLPLPDVRTRAGMVAAMRSRHPGRIAP